MSVHPVTPMDEADLRVHLARQAPLADREVHDLADLGGDRDAVDARMRRAGGEPDALLFDSAGAEQLAEVGRLLAAGAARSRSSSSGPPASKYALTRTGAQAGCPAQRAPASTVSAVPARAGGIGQRLGR